MLSPRSLLSLVAVLGLSTQVVALVPNWNTTGAFRIAATKQYTLRDNYNSGNFFNAFDFLDAPDPTHGFVSYQPQAAARSRGLINNNNNKVYMGVDYKTMNPSPGRASVRVTSKKAYNKGLFIADIVHMPQNACGVWPAFWLFGPAWPNSGEIDIIEGVNQQSTNAITLHTAAGCNINTAGSQAGTSLHSSNCNENAAMTGCSASTSQPYGDRFNALLGGVYAMQWESTGIYVWFWPRSRIPSDIATGRPNTAYWGPPVVSFNGGSGCNIDRYFKDQKIVFDTTFCGDWAGGVWASSSCAKKATTCQNYVASNPSAFQRAYWSINSVKVYQM